ncbi:Brix domain-containing protein [Colletotrichum higginsianum IMI 349063]|uniref:U3 small nucleolar ribonucleoprotein protein IMP4 n=1 Tax=Colletotrichum higginsianum (strain IMI 349063) TaxID=759273 RepID=A0A1B7Y6C1_COLHI|nr:Brix domain-containing protein [Colletotrichum higginsianum IMI 349063]OBR07591.1 Brix domain-containing protein [Colletotrichum higginsianum IMI 349063]
MIRKQARQRRDYLYRKAQILKDAETGEKRAQLRSALAAGKPLDPEIARDKTLRKDFQYDQSKPELSAQEEMDLDDEYSMLSGVSEPRVLVTTSRDCSSRLAAFSKEIRLLLPTSVRLNRGNLILPDLVQSCKSNALTDLVLLHEHRGNPTALTISHLPHGPTVSFSLHNVVLRHDIPGSIRGSVSEAYPHLIFEGFKSRLGQRIVKVLKHLFPPRDPISSRSKIGNRVVTFLNNVSHFSFQDLTGPILTDHDSHVFVRTSYDSVELAEVGPRMTMRPFEIRGGTLDSKEGDVEWHLTHYTRTGRKKEYL